MSSVFRVPTKLRADAAGNALWAHRQMNAVERNAGRAADALRRQVRTLRRASKRLAEVEKVRKKPSRQALKRLRRRAESGRLPKRLDAGLRRMGVKGAQRRALAEGIADAAGLPRRPPPLADPELLGALQWTAAPLRRIADR